MKKLLFLIFVGVVAQQFSTTVGKRQRVFFREVTPTTSDAIIRSQRGVIAVGYQNKVVEQHNDATVALEEARRSTQATQLLTENLQASIKLRQQLGTLQQQQMPIEPGAIRLVDQYGNEVGGMPQLQGVQQNVAEVGGGYQATYSHSPQPPSVIQTLPQKMETEVPSNPPETQNAYLPPPLPQTQVLHQVPQTQVQIQPQQQQQLVYSQAQYLPQPVYLQPQIQAIQAESPQLIQTQQLPPTHFIQPHHHHEIRIHQPQQFIQQFMTPEGLIFHQLVDAQPQPQLISQVQLPQPQPLPPQIVYHHQRPSPQYVPQTTVVHQQQPQEPVQIYHHHHPIHVGTPVPVVKKVVHHQPIVSKTVISPPPPPPVEVVEEVVVPTVKLVKQPILTPADFQKEIFAVKNPSVRVLTFSDLCTVYPYQRKLSACVYKKAAIPELHHPDIQLVPEQTKTVTQPPKLPPPPQSLVSAKPTPKSGNGYTGEGLINPRTHPLRLQAPSKGDDTGAGSIQDILRRDRTRNSPTSSSESSEGGEDLDDEIRKIVEEHEQQQQQKRDEEENTNIAAESSNQKEKLVIRTTKRTTSTERPKRKSSMRNRSGKNSATTKVPRKISSTTTTTTPNPSSSSTTRKSKKAKRRSRNSKRRASERKSKKRDSTSTISTPTTIEQLFRLA